MGTPRGRWPRARGKRKQGARWGVGGREATERNSFSAWGVANLLSPGPRVFTRPTSGSAGPPRSAAPAPSHAPLTRHLSPGLRFVCAFFFPFLSRPAPAAGRLLPPSPALRLPSPGGLPFPGCAPGPRDAFSAPCAGEPSPNHPSRLGAALGAAGARGAGGPEPSTPEVPGADPESGGWRGGAVRPGRGVAAGGDGEDGSSLDLGRERARGRGEAARARREKGARAVQ